MKQNETQNPAAGYAAPEMSMTEIIVENGFAGSPEDITDGFELNAPGYGEGETI